MVDLELTEDEQLEALKKWWKENGKAIIFGIVLGLSIIIAVPLWRNHQAAQAEKASDIYVQFENAINAKEAATAKARVLTLKNEYGGTPYAVMAALGMAKYYVEQGDFKTAEETLLWAVDNASEEVFMHIAQIRLLTILLKNNKLDEVAQRLAKIKGTAFSADYAEIRGDMYVKQQQYVKAKQAYQLALANMQQNKRREFIEMKLNELAAYDTPAPQQEAMSNTPKQDNKE